MGIFDEVPSTLEPASYNAVFHLMVDRLNPRNPDYYFPGDPAPVESSFSGAMAYLLEFNHPEVILFTHKSAVPIADSVRGYYEELGLPTPELAIINTKEDPESDFELRSRSFYASDAVVEREVGALRNVLDGRPAAIIDQYIDQAYTVLKADHIAREAGATSVGRPAKAKWYHNAKRIDINFEEVSSVHASKMRKIGRAAAQFELPADWKTAYYLPFPGS